MVVKDREKVFNKDASFGNIPLNYTMLVVKQ